MSSPEPNNLRAKKHRFGGIGMKTCICENQLAKLPELRDGIRESIEEVAKAYLSSAQGTTERMTTQFHRSHGHDELKNPPVQARNSA